MERAEYPVPFIYISKARVLRDEKLGLSNNNGRRVCATTVMPEFGEREIEDPRWNPPAILPTGDGGLEIATFTEFASQDRHKHESAIEIYTVLAGDMQMYIDDAGPHALQAGDEVVILPGTVHQVVQSKPREREEDEDFDLLVRVHAIGCRGADDKFVQLEKDGKWRAWSELSRDERKSSYKL